MRRVFSCLCVCGMGALSAMSLSEDEKFRQWQSSIECPQGALTKSSDNSIKELGEEGERRLDVLVAEHSYAKRSRGAKSCKVFVRACLERVFYGCIEAFRTNSSYERFRKEKDDQYTEYLRYFWSVGEACGKVRFWDSFAFSKKGQDQVAANQKFHTYIKEIWLAGGREMFCIHRMDKSSFDLLFSDFDSQKVFLKVMFDDWWKKEGGDNLMKLFPQSNQEEARRMQSDVGEVPPKEGSSGSFVGGQDGGGISNNQQRNEFGQDNGQMEVGGRWNFVEAVVKLIIEKIGSVRSTADLEEKRRFLLSDVKGLVDATMGCYPVSTAKNKIQEFLLTECEGESLEFSEMNTFFSHFDRKLLRSLYGAFANWGSTKDLKIVLLHGRAGVGKSDTLSWLFEKNESRDVREGIAVIKASSGDSLIGSKGSPGILDVLLLQKEYWRCICLPEDSPLVRAALGELVERLTYDGKKDVWFRSEYFDMLVPVKNVVITCSSNDERGFLEKRKDGIEYVEVKFGKFKEGHLEAAVGRMYLEEFEKNFSKGREMWEDIHELKKSRSLSGLFPAIYRLKDSFDKQVGKHGWWRNTAQQVVADFIVTGGEDEWLRWKEDKNQKE